MVNPVNDADDFSKQLVALGFKVFLVKNQSRSEIRESIINYGEYVNDNPEVALFYYAGHGIQSSGINYMIPINANITREWEVQDECIKVDAVLRMLQSYCNPANIIILDACRNNPYARSFRGGDKGLTNQQYNFTGSIIAYATAPGNTASDGEGRNGLYTQELIKALQIPGLSVEDVFKRVRINVSRLSNKQQIPWEDSSLMGNYYFNENKLIPNSEVFTPAKISEETELPVIVELPSAEKRLVRLHISSSPDNNLASTFEIMHANSQEIDLGLLGDFKSFGVSSFGKGNSAEISIRKGYEYQDTTFYIPNMKLFRRASDAFNKTGISIIDSLIENMKSNIDFTLLVEGHTALGGSSETNMRLSEVRIKSIRDYLTDNGIRKNRIRGNFYGDTRPIVMARTREVALENGRFEFRLIKTSLNVLLYFETDDNTINGNEIKKPRKIRELLEKS